MTHPCHKSICDKASPILHISHQTNLLSKVSKATIHCVEQDKNSVALKQSHPCDLTAVIAQAATKTTPHASSAAHPEPEPTLRSRADRAPQPRGLAPSASCSATGRYTHTMSDAPSEEQGARMRPPVLTPVGHVLSAATVLLVLVAAAVFCTCLEIASFVQDQLDSCDDDCSTAKKEQSCGAGKGSAASDR